MRSLDRLMYLVPTSLVSHLRHRGLGICKVGVLLIVMFSLFVSPSFGKDKLKQDKFAGIVVNTGPTAITIKSKDNIYLLRTFSYTPQVEAKVKKKPPQPGKKVTVHYFRGSDVATKID
jgi:hypothetical protein